MDVNKMKAFARLNSSVPCKIRSQTQEGIVVSDLSNSINFPNDKDHIYMLDLNNSSFWMLHLGGTCMNTQKSVPSFCGMIKEETALMKTQQASYDSDASKMSPLSIYRFH